MWKISESSAFNDVMCWGRVGGYSHGPYIPKRTDRLLSRGSSYFTEMFEVVVF